MWSVRVLSGQHAGEIFDLKLGKNVLGRGGQSNFKVVSLGISKEHCEIHVYPDKMMIVDLKSSNGTFVNGVKVQNSLLRVGDKISLFDIILDVIPKPEIRPRPSRVSADKSLTVVPAHSSTPANGQYGGSAAPQLYSDAQNFPVMHPQMQTSPLGFVHNQSHLQFQPEGMMAPEPPKTSNQNPQSTLTFSEKFDRYMENVVMPVIYRLAILFPFKQVLMGFVIINIFAVTLLSMFPMSTLMQESNLVEATKRAKSVARALAKFNEQALLTGQLGQLSVQEAMKEEGIREALIIQQSDGLIVAPAEKAGRDTSRSFVIQARKEGRSFSAKVDANTIGASHPIGVYDPLTGEPSVKYHAMVLYDVSSLNVDQERMISLFMQTLIIASLFGLLLYYLFSRMMDYPIRHLNQQIEKALLEQSDRTEVIYDYPIFQQLVSNVNTLLNRVWTVQSASTGGMSTQQNKDLELSHLVDMITTPACAVSNDDRLIAVNTSFEQLTQSSRETLVNQNYQSITDTSLVQNIESLIVRARQSPYEKHEDRIPFSQFECQIYCQAFLDSQGQPENFIFTLVQQQ